MVGQQVTPGHLQEFFCFHPHLRWPDPPAGGLRQQRTWIVLKVIAITERYFNIFLFQQLGGILKGSSDARHWQAFYYLNPLPSMQT